MSINVKSFFSRLKKQMNTDLGGRYMEIILQEILFEDIAYIRAFFPGIDVTHYPNKNAFEVKIEDVFHKRRRADLTVSYEGKLIACMEIKYEDFPLEDQIDDYVDFAKKRGIAFTYLTQYRPKVEHMKIIARARTSSIVHLLYSDVYLNLQKMQQKKYSHVVELFLKFIKENVMIYNSDFIQNNEDTLKTLVIRGLHLKHANGFGRRVKEDNLLNIPQAWTVLLGNCQTLGDRFRNDFPSLFNKRPSVNFVFDPYFNRKLLAKDIGAEIDDHIYLNRERKTGGYFSVWAQGKLRSSNPNHWCGISLGYSFCVDVEEGTFTKYFFATVSGKNRDWDKQVVLSRSNMKEEKIYSALLNCTKGAIKKCLADKNNSDWNRGTGFNSSLRRLSKELERKF